MWQSFWQSGITSIITIGLGWVTIWVRNKLRRKQQMESERDIKKREAIENMLKWHSERLLNSVPSEDALRRLLEMSRDMAVWAPDEVLLHYFKFLEKRFPEILKSIKPHEIHLGKAILAFRRERGFPNKNDKLKPSQVAAIFRAGWKTPV